MGFSQQERESTELRLAGTGGPREEGGRKGGKGNKKKKTREGGRGSLAGGALFDWLQLNREPPILIIRVRLLRSSAFPLHPTAPRASGFSKQKRKVRAEARQDWRAESLFDREALFFSLFDREALFFEAPFERKGLYKAHSLKPI